VRKLRRCLLLLLLLLGGGVLSAEAASAKLIKVLPQYLDREGRHAVSPSLFDRDAYQAQLRRRPEERAGVRFAIQWKAPHSARLKLKVELRGALGQEPTTALLEQPVEGRHFFSHWSAPKLAGNDFKKFGDLIAWRVSLWEGDKQLAELKSFLWQ